MSISLRSQNIIWQFTHWDISCHPAGWLLSIFPGRGGPGSNLSLKFFMQRLCSSIHLWQHSHAITVLARLADRHWFFIAAVPSLLIFGIDWARTAVSGQGRAWRSDSAFCCILGHLKLSWGATSTTSSSQTCWLISTRVHFSGKHGI